MLLASVKPSISASIRPSVNRPMGITAGYHPASSADILQVLSPFTYAASPLASLPVLSSSVGTAAVPRGQRCVLFDGVNDIAQRSYMSEITTFTATCWVKMALAGGNATYGRGVIRNIAATANIGDFFLGVLPTGAVAVARWSTTNVDATGLRTSASGAVASGQWTHLAATFDGTTLRVYVNSSEVALPNTNSTGGGWGVGFFLGSTYTLDAGYFSNGNQYDARVYNVAKSAAEIATIYNQHLTPSTIDRTGALAIWPLQEESGTTHYDISGNGRNLTATNITQATYHATDAGVKYSFANELGYTQSGNVIIPRNEAVPTQDAAGGALQFSGPIALSGVMEVSCYTGNGTNSYVDCGANLISGDFTFAIKMFAPTSAGQTTILSSGDGSIALFINPAANEINLFFLTANNNLAATGATVVPEQWNDIVVTRAGNNWTVTANGSSTISGTRNQVVSGNTVFASYRGLSQFSAARIGGASILASGVTRYPLFGQCGPGSSNTNRDFYIMGSDGSATLVSGGIVNGTVASIYANRCPFVRDWCIENGGSIAANGAFIPGRIGSSLDAAGNAKTLPAGEHCNPFSRFDPNNWSAPSLVNIGSTASDAYAPTDMAGVQAESVADTRYGSQRRYAAFKIPQTGSDKTNAEGWAAG